ncbi:MAG: PhnD/SsuA/transferrin family substrate-binding protein [Gammaproteobacteria bacterium]|nr:PhnD/SsuA/transferrin family substrate-binding protein [Gammaproteobacteria bacterium]
MSSHGNKIIACGMYAFTPELEQAWQQLFDIFIEVSGDAAISLSLGSDQTLLREPDLLFGHTCGYPLMTRLKDYLTPFCVPVFDVPGTDGKFYSSRFIIGASSTIDSLAQSQNKIAVINDADSNSGMNVFRHAVAGLTTSTHFFSSVRISGGHLHSLEAVADGNADIAAIDCVSYQLIEDQWPELTSRVRSIGFSAKTCGLPFVLPLTAVDSVDRNQWVDGLNRALGLAPEAVRKRLHLKGFEAVTLQDYQGIVDLENIAINAGYAKLD